MLAYAAGDGDLTSSYCIVTHCAGALMAIEYINRDGNILGDYQLELLVEDTQCKVDVAMKHFFDYAVLGDHPVVAILGKYFMSFLLVHDAFIR